VIRARFAAVAVACVVSVFANRFLVKLARENGQKTGLDEWDQMLDGWGEWKVNVWQTIHALGLTAFLFLGPLFERVWIQEGWRSFSSELHYSVTSLFGWRTYIIVNPV
jgi:prenyl protein peptidase